MDSYHKMSNHRRILHTTCTEQN